MPHINRLVLNFPGFETTSAVHQIGRLSAGGQKTAKLWGFTLSARDARSDYPHKTICEFESQGPGWTASTRYVHFSWTDIISKYEDVPYPKSLLLHLPKYLSFFFDGSAYRYVKNSGRYFGFTVYPLLLMILFAAVSAGQTLLLGFAAELHLGVAGLLGILLFVALCKYPGDLFYVNLSVNDWAFARDMCNSTNPEITERFDEFATHLADEVSKNRPDEIIIVGHSFGSVWASAALAIALEREPQLFSDQRVTFLALGSSLLKIGLVPQAEFLRNYVRRVVSEETLMWHEIQTKTDFISFHKAPPFSPMNIDDHACELIVHRVNFKNALSKARHSKMMKSMYLAHRQYILYCDQRIYHDYQLRVFGPFFADELARDLELASNSDLVGKEVTTQ